MVYFVAVQHYVDQALVAGDLDVVPLSGRSHRVPAWPGKVIDRSGVVITRRGRIENLHFDAVKADVLARAWLQRGGADKNATVATWADFEIQFQFKIGPLLGVN